MIKKGLSEIIGPFPVPSLRDKRERNDDPGQKRRGHRYSEHPSNRTIPIDDRDRRSVNYLDHSQLNAIAIGDFNGDGKLDVACGGYFSDLSILIGNGDGTFQNAVDYHLNSVFGAMVAADFNGDGRTDLAFTLESPGWGSIDYDVTLPTEPTAISVMIGNGDGTFQSAESYHVVNAPDALVAADFNGDGILDLAVRSDSVRDAAPAIAILTGIGDGTFQKGAVYPLESAFGGLATADFNGDGTVDLATSGSVSMLWGNGDGTFHVPTKQLISGIGGYETSGDFNNDGKLDLAVANTTASTVSILFGNGNGTFQSGETLAVGLYPDVVTAGDWNGDGRPDLAVGNYGSNDISILLGDGVRRLRTE